MKVYLFLLCYNEVIILRQTVEHYRQRFQNANLVITIYDNHSTDGSVELARELGCNVIRFSSGNIQNELQLRFLKNECWKGVEADAWVIVCDMDEWLEVTEEDLRREREAGVSILKTQGYEMMGESKKLDLSDIDLHALRFGYPHDAESKKICFWRGGVKEMRFEAGAHVCRPISADGGETVIIYSDTVYPLCHLNKLGLPYYANKMIARYQRTALARSQGMSTHYTMDIREIIQRYDGDFKKAYNLSF